MYSLAVSDCDQNTKSIQHSCFRAIEDEYVLGKTKIMNAPQQGTIAYDCQCHETSIFLEWLIAFNVLQALGLALPNLL